MGVVLILGLILGIPPVLGVIAGMVLRSKGYPEATRAAALATGLYVAGTLALAGSVVARATVVTADWAWVLLLVAPVLLLVANLFWIRATPWLARGAVAYGLGFTVPVIPAAFWVGIPALTPPWDGALAALATLCIPLGTLWVVGGGAVMLLGWAFLAERHYPED